jgi:XTP/dITP diphosphohydrolase
MSSKSEIVLASSNRGKLAELRQLLPDWVRVRTADEAGVTLPEETGTTFAENAFLKARAAAAQTGLIAIADDSGLEVDILEGAPGVRSARFAGERAADAENNALLLEQLRGVPPERRTARFRSVVAAVIPGGTELAAEGVIEGRIVEIARGSGGFGYDSLFQPAGYSRTMAELTMDEKNRISHRGQALRKVAGQLVPLLREVDPVPE